MASERSGSAPTTTIQTQLLVRPVKVLAVVLAAVALMLMMLSVAATSWLEASSTREGLWEKCVYHPKINNIVECSPMVPRDWLHACRALCLTAIAVCLIGVFVICFGLRTLYIRAKYKIYMAGMVIWFTAVALQLTSLVTFPIKFLDDITDRTDPHWEFGWAYGLGWAAAILIFISGILILIDKDAEEVVYREITVKSDRLEETNLAA